MERLKTTIEQVGQEMVKCDARCAGVRCDQPAGAVPRCLILETEGRASGLGCAVIGINPGHASETERAFYRVHGAKYDVIIEYWTRSVGFQHRYYVRIRRFLDQVGLVGPILWTELAKCENAPGYKGLPPLMTLRTCTRRYLGYELMALPSEWPLVALDGEAFKALAYLYPQRSVIGVPHPTGSFGHFLRLMPHGEVLPEIRRKVQQMLGHLPGQLLWLETGVSPREPNYGVS